MLIVYRKGDIRTQVVAWGADRERRVEGLCLSRVRHHCKNPDIAPPTELEAIFTACGAITPSAVRRPRGRDAHEDEEEESDDPSSKMRSAAAMTNGKHARNIRSSAAKKGGDSDSDFDL